MDYQTPPTIPSGWIQITTGSVEVGDRVFATSTRQWIDVTDEIMSHLGFLDAQSVEDCTCVIRRLTLLEQVEPNHVR